MSDNPFAKYRDAAPSSNPFAKYARSEGIPPPAPQPETGVMSALWDGLQHGLGNIAMGAGRLGAAVLYPKEMQEDIGKVAQFRDKEFAGKPTTRQHPTATATGEFAGEALATSPLAAGAGAGAGTWARAAWGALTGAGGGAVGAASSAPQDRFGRSVVTGAGLGAAAGGALGAGGAMVRPSVLERPVLNQPPAPAPAPQPPPRPPMLALPPPTVGVAGQPATQTGASVRDRMVQGAMGQPMPGPRPGMMPPGPNATMVRDQPPVAPLPPPPPAAVQRPQGPPPPKSWTEAARMLDRSGVRLSPGQARNMSEMERTLQTWPILRGFVRGQVGRSVDDFDRAVVQQTLAPIGGTVPRSVPAGHALMEFGAKRFDEAYNPLLPHLNLSREGVANRLQNDPEMQQVVGGMSEDHIRRLTNMVNGFMTRFDDRGMMNGPIFKRAESELAYRANNLSGGQDDELARALRRTLGMFRDELADQNPQFGPELQKINHAFSLFAEARAAGVRDATSRGRFEPSDLLNTIRHGASDDSFSRGLAPLQAFAEAGEEVIGPSLTSRRPELSRSAARVLGDTAAGATLTPAYLAAAAAQRVPGLGRGIGALSPSVGAAIGDEQSKGRRAIRRVQVPAPQ